MKQSRPTNLAALIKVLRRRSGAGILDCKRALVASNYDLTAAWTWLRTKGKVAVAKKQARATNAGGVFGAAGTVAAVVFELKSETDFVVRNQRFLQLARDIATALTTATADFAGGGEWGRWPAPNGRHIQDLINDQIQTIGENIVLGRVLRVKKKSDVSFSVYNHYNHRLAAVCAFRGAVVDQQVADDVAMHVATIKPDYLRWSDVDDQVLKQEHMILTQQLEQDPAIKQKPQAIVDKIIAGRMKKTLGKRVLSNQPFVLHQEQTVAQLLQKHHLDIVNFVRLSVDES